MTLLDIKNEEARLLQNICDEDGVINEEVYEQLQALEIPKAQKIDGWCFFIKERKAELIAAKAILDEAERRYKAYEKQLDKIKERFEMLMEGEKHKSTLNTVFYRNSKSVTIDEGIAEGEVIRALQNGHDELLTYKEPTLNKTKIKEALERGEELYGLHLEENTSMVIR